MTLAAGTDDLLIGFLRQRLAAGDDGKTLLVGLDGALPVFALAAGLHGEADHPRFLDFARYLLHQRFGCDGYGLLLPAIVDGAALYLVERRCGGTDAVLAVDAGGAVRDSGFAVGMIGDLTRRGTPLPGLKRREFDRLFEALRLPPPV